MKLFLRRSPVAFALFAGLFLIPAGRAQPASQIGDSRYLIIFDTSAEMKKRLPAVETEVNELMSTSLGGRLRMGDTIGVWTFGRDLHTGQFPLQSWSPDEAGAIASAINKLVRKQHYSGETRFDALQPELGEVIRNSGRLTVLIFCDGHDEIKWTPYDAGINQFFQQRLAEQQKTRQPFVLVLRTQLGKYAGCTMNFPPGMVNIPEFPPPPAPPVPIKVPAVAPPPPPVVKPQVVTPLIIIGTNVVTSWPPAPAPPPPNPAPEKPAKVAPIEPTNPVAPMSTNALTNPVAPPPPTNFTPTIQTNAAAAPAVNPSVLTNSTPVTTTKPVPTPQSNVTPPASPVVSPPAASLREHKGALAIGEALLIAAGALVVLAVFRSRRSSRDSLITRAMRKD